MSKRTIVSVEKAERGWDVVIRCDTKREAIALGRRVARAIEPSELKPRRADGTFDLDGRETYPRSSDPKKSRG